MGSLIPSVAHAQTATGAKLDESLRESVERGCVGTKSVIIRTARGYRPGLVESLAAHGDVVTGEFPALDAVAADVHCDDLKTLAAFLSTRSVSVNAPVGVQAAAQKPVKPVKAAHIPPGQAKKIAAAREQARKEEGKAAKGLKKKFFATLPVLAELGTVTDADLESSTAPYEGFGEVLASGPSIGVAIIDSGIEPGADFGDRLTAFYDFTHGDIRAVAATDGYGHGTHVAGLVASTFVGVAPNARLIGLKVLDDKGRGTTTDVLRAIEFAITNKDLLGIDILNLSLGHPIFEPAATDPLVQAVEHAARVGIVVVVSAGNFGLSQTGQAGYAGIASPGNAPSGLSVGAVQTFNTITRLDDRIAPFSSRGPSWYDGFAKPDVVAPGDNLLSVAAAGSTLRLAQEQRGNTGNYMRLSGTSMAAGTASGVAALLLQANRGLTPNALKAVLQYSAIPVSDDAGTPYDALVQGTGQIAVTGALTLARSIDSSAPLGGSWVSGPSLVPETLIGNQRYSWSQSILWGNRRVRGAKLLLEQRPAWALSVVWGEGLGSEDDNIVWGNHASDDDNIVWGNLFDADDNVVWGNNLVWGRSDDDDNIVWGNRFDVLGNRLADDDNIVWGNYIIWGDRLLGILDDDDNIVWGNLDDDNVVWGNLDDDNVVWGNLYDDHIVVGNNDDDNVVWGNHASDDDNIVWGNKAAAGTVIQWSGGLVGGKATNARARRTRSRGEGRQ